MQMTIGATLFVIAILILILVLNANKEKKPTYNPVASGTEMESVTDTKPPYEGMSPDDFDFWELYPENTEGTESGTTDDAEKEPETDPATDGKHTLVVNNKGEEEWVVINQYLPKHSYDFTKLVCQSDLMKYYKDGKKVSYVGADISKHQDYVDFVKLKKAGVDFVMLRVGSRGYRSGQLQIDEYFLDNIKRASDAGLKIGLYFSSQAITREEAAEEAKLLLDHIKDYTVQYPIAIDMGFVKNDTSRVDGLTKEQRTENTKAFLEEITRAGYIPMIYGDKNWLIKQIDMTEVASYDVWLSQPGDLPDYPYKFTMWQYSTTAGIDGIAGYANLNISFIDYSEK